MQIWIPSKQTSRPKIVKKSTKKLKLQLRYIFILFQMCAVFGSSKSVRHFHNIDRVKCFTFILNTFIFIFHLCCNISFTVTLPGIAISKANAAMTIAAMLHRLVLCSRINNIQMLTIRMAKLANNLNVHFEEKKAKGLYILLFLSTFLYIPVIICSAVAMNEISFKAFAFNSDIEDPILKMALIITFNITFILFLTVPINIFALYYTVVCRHLRSIIITFKKSLNSRDHLKKDDVFENYLAIRRFATHMDEELSFLIFTSSLFNACIMYFGVTCFLHPEEYISTFQSASIWFLVPASYIPFFAMTVSACFVHEASTGVYNKGQELLRFGRIPTFSQLRILYVTEKELTLTVWKIVPIKRNFLMAAMGTIFTYCILLDNLRWATRK